MANGLDKVDEFIWLQLCHGLRSGEILAALANDQVGVGRPIAMADRTLRSRIQRLKEERGDPAVMSLSGGLQGRIAERAVTEISKLLEEQKLDGKDVDLIGKWRRLLVPALADAGAQWDPPGGEEPVAGPKAALFKQIQKDEANRVRDPEDGS